MSQEVSVSNLAHSYAGYVKVDKQKEMQALDESIEDTLTRLEELESGIHMLQAEREKFGSTDFTVARSNLNALSQKIHKLDEMSKQVWQDVEALESVVNDAEVNLTNSAEGKLKNILKPLLFMRSETAAPLSTSSSQFTPSSTFSSASFFPKPKEDDSTPTA